MNKDSLRAGVIGASGYTGQELVRILGAHPRLTVAFATSESEAGQVYGRHGERFISVADAPLSEVDLVFSCLPNGVSSEWSLRAAAAGPLVIDLSSDLRQGAEGAVYGLPELWRDRIRGSRLVANPGCYPTAALIGLAPAFRSGLVDGTRPIVIDAASGVTGAGRAARRDLLFSEVAEDYRAYGVGNRHRHVPELATGLSELGAAHPFVFTPHLLPVRRGILETIYLPLTAPLTGGDAVDLWSAAYEAEPFVELHREGLPSLRDVVGRNVVALGFSEVEVSPPMLLVVAAVDNLIKGAAGQAVQNANLILGWPESEGLPV